MVTDPEINKFVKNKNSRRAAFLNLNFILDLKDYYELNKDLPNFDIWQVLKEVNCFY